jgi:hypothetical protein
VPGLAPLVMGLAACGSQQGQGGTEDANRREEVQGREVTGGFRSKLGRRSVRCCSKAAIFPEMNFEPRALVGLVLLRPAADDLSEVLAWREERTFTKNLTLHYDRMMLLLDPTPLARIRAAVSRCSSMGFRCHSGSSTRSRPWNLARSWRTSGLVRHWQWSSSTRTLNNAASSTSFPLSSIATISPPSANDQLAMPRIA